MVLGEPPTVGERVARPYCLDMPAEDLPAGQPTARRSRGGRVRAVAFRVVLVLFAVVWLTFGFGIIDFVSGLTSTGDTDPVGIGVLSLAYGAVAGIVLPVAFLALVRAPERRPAAVQQIVAVTVAFALAGAAGLDPLSFVSVATLVVMLAALLAVHPARPQILPGAGRAARPVLVLTALAAVPWLVYALDAAANSRQAMPPDDMAARPQAGGWAGATVMAFVVLLLAVLAATRSPGSRVPLWSAALTSFVFGVASVLSPQAPGSAGRLWGALAVAWGLVLLITGELDRERRELALGGDLPAS